MIDIVNQKPLSIEEARHLPIIRQPDGSPPAWGTVNGWIRDGVRGVRLGFAMLPGRTVTTQLAVQQFIENDRHG